MGIKNDYLRRITADKEDCYNTGIDIGMQAMFDFMCITLGNPEIMGKDTFGAERLEKVREESEKLYHTFKVCFTNDKEADVKQRDLDFLVKERFGKKFQPFYERYPRVQGFDYTKSHKGWR